MRGGDGTYRLDAGSIHGSPEAICIMPEGHNSEWSISERFEFAHLYIEDEQLRTAYSEIFDRDARLMDMEDLTFVKNQTLANALRDIYISTHKQDRLAGQEAASNVIHAVFSTDGCLKQNRPQLTGGLASNKRRQVLDYIQDNLETTIGLRELADLVGLSEFHFQRSFRASCGTSPHKWIANKRVERARELIVDKVPLAQVALACGYSSQAHFSRSFSSAMNMTPKAYRTAISA